jgi:hypothetical protein
VVDERCNSVRVYSLRRVEVQRWTLCLREEGAGSLYPCMEVGLVQI